MSYILNKMPVTVFITSPTPGSEGNGSALGMLPSRPLPEFPEADAAMFGANLSKFDQAWCRSIPVWWMTLYWMLAALTFAPADVAAERYGFNCEGSGPCADVLPPRRLLTAPRSPAVPPSPSFMSWTTDCAQVMKPAIRIASRSNAARNMKAREPGSL